MVLWLCFSVFNFFSQPVLWNVEEMGWSLEAILQFIIVFNIILYLLSYSSKFYFLCAVRNYFKTVVFLRRLYLHLGKQIFSVHKMRMCFICIQFYMFIYVYIQFYMFYMFIYSFICIQLTDHVLTQVE